MAQTWCHHAPATAERGARPVVLLSSDQYAALSVGITEQKAQGQLPRDGVVCLYHDGPGDLPALNKGAIDYLIAVQNDEPRWRSARRQHRLRGVYILEGSWDMAERLSEILRYVAGAPCRYHFVDRSVYANIKISQIHVASYLRSQYHQPVMANYPHFVDYYDPEQPCVFFGMYEPEQLSLLRKHRSLGLVVWTASDLDRSDTVVQRNLEAVKSLPNVRHIAVSKMIQQTLQKLGLASARVPFHGLDFSEWKPVAKGPCVLISTKPPHEEYGRKIYSQVMSRFPQLTFLLSCDHAAEDPRELYARCFIALRLTDLDGLPTTVLELGHLGIKCIHNSDLPHCVSYVGLEGIFKAIEAERHTVGQTDADLAQRVRQSLKAGDDWLYPHRYYPGALFVKTC